LSWPNTRTKPILQPPRRVVETSGVEIVSSCAGKVRHIEGSEVDSGCLRHTRASRDGDRRPAGVSSSYYGTEPCRSRFTFNSSSLEPCNGIPALCLDRHVGDGSTQRAMAACIDVCSTARQRGIRAGTIAGIETTNPYVRHRTTNVELRATAGSSCPRSRPVM
jgi:hypothetical protein